MTTEYRDHVLPDGAWSFDGEVAGVFGEMLARSIPQYDEMRRLTFELGAPFVEAGARGRVAGIVDLGASDGGAVAPFVDRFGARARYDLVEVSEPFLAKLAERFGGYVDPGIVRIRNVDLRGTYPPVVDASLVLSVLTLQFTPIEYRQSILSRIVASLAPGGALVLVEKVLGEGAELDELFVERYLAMKADHGYSTEEIDRKRHSLEGVLVPVTAAWNEELLRRAGFRAVDCFWRWLNFAGWIAVR